MVSWYKKKTVFLLAFRQKLEGDAKSFWDQPRALAINHDEEKNKIPRPG